MKDLLSGYHKTAHELMFRVYLAEIPETERRLQAKLSHLTALDLLSAALCRDFGIRHGKIARAGLEKPQLLHENLHMNLSHCRGLAAAAVGRFPLGIDAETPRPVREKLLPKLCAPGEAACILAAEDRELMFSRIWTLKESYGKLTGEGIRMKLTEYEFQPGNPPVCLHPEAENYLFYQKILDNQYIISLCVPRGDYDVIWNHEENRRGLSNADD